jgi:hypothetical protein
MHCTIAQLARLLVYHSIWSLVHNSWHCIDRYRHLALIAGAAAHAWEQKDADEPCDWATVLLSAILLLHYIDYLLSIALGRARSVLRLRLILPWSSMLLVLLVLLLLLCILRVVRWVLRVSISYYISLL